MTAVRVDELAGSLAELENALVSEHVRMRLQMTEDRRCPFGVPRPGKREYGGLEANDSVLLDTVRLMAMVNIVGADAQITVMNASNFDLLHAFQRLEDDDRGSRHARTSRVSRLGPCLRHRLRRESSRR